MKTESISLTLIGIAIVTMFGAILNFQIHTSRLQNEINRDLLMRVTALESCGCQSSRETALSKQSRRLILTGRD